MYKVLLDYYAVADNGRVSELVPLEATVEPVAEATPAAGRGATGKSAKPTAAATKTPAKKGGAAGVGDAEGDVAAPVDPLDAAMGAALSSASIGRAIALSALRNVAKVRAAQDTERRARWNAALVANAAIREAWEAAAEAAANPGKGAKGAAKAKAPAKSAAKGKGAVEGPVVEDPNPNFVFVNEAVLDVIVFEAQQLVNRLEYLCGQCRLDCQEVASQAASLFTDLHSDVASASATDGAAVEALASHVVSAIEAHQRLDNKLQLQVRCALQSLFFFC